MTLRKEGEPALCGAGHALAQELSRADRDLGLDHVVRSPEGIAERVQEHEDPVPLIVLQREPHRGGRGEPGEDESSQDPQPHPGRDEQGDQDGKQQEGGAEVGLLDDQRRRHDGQRGRHDEHGLVHRLRPARRQQPHDHQDEAELEELGGLHRERAHHEPAAGARHRAAESEHRDEHAEADQVEQRRRPHQPAIVDAGDDRQRDDAEAEPGDLPEGDAAARPADVERGQRGGAERDETHGGAEQRPVDVLQEPAIDAEGHPRISTAATFSRKMVLKICRAIGAAASPP